MTTISSTPDQRRRMPDFFIIGAPKCGTTAMASYLAQHPAVDFSRIKEPNFFDTDLKEQELFDDLEDYLSTCFPQAKEGPRGEGSVWYLYSQKAVDEILQHQPEARFVVMLRQPVDLVHALHSTFLLAFIEEEEDFAKAWDLQETRRQGNKLPKGCKEPLLLQYGAVGKTGEQVARLLNKVAREQVHFILFDDFKANSRQAYLELLQFLGVKDDGRIEFPPVNQSAATKNKTMGAWLYGLAQNPIIHRLKRKSGLPLGRGPIVRFLQKNRKTRPRPAMAPELRSALVDYFSADIDLLAGLIGRKLEHWKK